MRRNQRFTLIELLIVISIIIILVGIAVPVYLVAMKKARAGQAQFQIKALQTAIVSYKTEYQYLPFYPGNAGVDDLQVNRENPGSSADGYADLLSTLWGNNPRRIEFLSNSNGTFVDPWGSSFQVTLDIRGDGEIREYTPPAPAVPNENKIPGSSPIATDIAIWSKGIDKEDSVMDDDYTKDEDNITSW